MDSNISLIKKSLSVYLQDNGVKDNVKINTYHLIENLFHLYMDKIDLESIYLSNWGTVLIDFEKDNNIFSIEIGSKSIGYFSEINSKTEHFCEEAFINSEDSFNSTMYQLKSDLNDFYNKI
jgi:hypothetical protein